MDETTFEERFAAARALAAEGRDEQALARLRELAADFPREPRAHAALGSLLDSLGQGAEAIPGYRRALELGLSGDDLSPAFP